MDRRVVVHDPRAGEVSDGESLRQFVQREPGLVGRARRPHRDGGHHPCRRSSGARAAGASHHGRTRGGVAGGGRRGVGRRHVRGVPHVLQPGAGRRPAPLPGPGAPARLPRTARRCRRPVPSSVAAGDSASIVSTFASDGYLREPIGDHAVHRGSEELQSFFARCFSAGGGLSLEQCATTDDGVRCVLEYNWLRWGGHELSPQAGLGVWERTPDGRLAAVRLYDDLEPPL